MSDNPMSTTDNPDPSNRRKTATRPQQGPCHDLLQAFDALPNDHHGSPTNHLEDHDSDATHAVQAWIAGDGETPAPATFADVLDHTDTTLVIYTGQGVAVVRSTMQGYERVSYLANDHQVHKLRTDTDTDTPRFSHTTTSRTAVVDWLAEYAADTRAAYQVIELALVPHSETDVWEHATRAGVKEPRPSEEA